MKLDRLTAALATLALASLCAAQRLSAQNPINCGGASEPAIGATCLVTNQVSVAVPAVARLQISSLTTGLTAPLAADFAPVGTGVSNPSGPTLTVMANVAWTVTASYAAANWTAAPVGPTKPATDLTITNDAGATYNAFPFAVATGTATASTTKQVGYHTNYHFDVDTPATYSLVINYTLTSP
jgi:hypothetical protein